MSESGASMSEGLGDDVARRVARLERVARWSDTAIGVPGMRFRVGWEAIIGLIPGIGDTAGAMLSLWIINEGRKLGVGRWDMVKMSANAGIDLLLGAVPILGDLFDLGFQANSRNLAIIRRSLERRVRPPTQ